MERRITHLCICISRFINCTSLRVDKREVETKDEWYFLRHAKIIAFSFGSYKNTFYLCNCQTMCSNTQIRARRNSSPELIKFRWAYFYAHIADHCNEDMADAFQ